MLRHGVFVFLVALSPALAIAEPPGKDGRVLPLSQSKDSVRVAVAQMEIDSSSLSPGQDTVDALVPWMKRAADEKADLIVFPEYLLGSFHLEGDLVEKLCSKASEHNLNVIVGGWEHFPQHEIKHPPAPGTYANTVLVVGRDGKVASFITCTHVVASNQSVGCGSAICSYPGWALQHSAPKPSSEAFLVGDLDLKEIRAQRLNNRMLHQRRPDIYQPLVERWEPWRAYPDLKPFEYDDVAEERP